MAPEEDVIFCRNCFPFAEACIKMVKDVLIMISGTVIILNMPSEHFKDAWFFYNRSVQETDNFIKRRYLRASCIFYCATVEAWYNKMIARYLHERIDNLSEKERKLYNFLTDPAADYFHKNVNNSLREHLPAAMRKDPTTLNQEKLEAYIAITRVRNKIAHYTDAGHNEAYNSDALSTLLSNAPQVIRELIEEYEPITSGHWVLKDYSNL